MSDERDGYQAYLLRLWRVPCQGRWQWRASLESPRTGERQLFAGLEQLFAFLGERCEERAPDAPEHGEEDECATGLMGRCAQGTGKTKPNPVERGDERSTR